MHPTIKTMWEIYQSHHEKLDWPDLLKVLKDAGGSAVAIEFMLIEVAEEDPVFVADKINSSGLFCEDAYYINLFTEALIYKCYTPE